MRARKGAARRKAKKKVFRAAKGYVGGRSKLWRTAKEAVQKGRIYATAHRKARKRDFRRLWITRINAAVRMRGMSYSRFMEGLRKSGVGLDRKVLAGLAVQDPAAFDEIVAAAKGALGAEAGSAGG
jgi:large subunit ribosomal protein L20